MVNRQNFIETCQTIVHWLTDPTPQQPHWSPETWIAFQHISLVHGVSPWLHYKLTNVDWLDPTIRSWLASQCIANEQRLAKMRQETDDILTCFNKHNIPIIPLKGIALISQYYDLPSVRPMNDLDFLIKPQHFQTAINLLARLDYQPHLIFWKNAEFIKPSNKQVISEQCEHPDNPRWVEMHRRCQEIFGGPVVDLTKLIWADVKRSQFLGNTAYIMSPDLLWLHLVVHTNADIWRGKFRLIQLLDLVQLMPHTKNLFATLNLVDARFTFLCLSMLERTFPNILEPALFTSQQRRVSQRFSTWSNTFNLVNASYLNEKPHTPYLSKVLRFNEGRPKEIGQAIRLMILPKPQDLRVDQTYLTKEYADKIPLMRYIQLWLKHIGGIIGRRIFSIGNEVR